jgi:hypothetical protein
VGTVAANVLEHGTGALNIDECRVPTEDKLGGGGEKAETSAKFTNDGWKRPWMSDPSALEAQASKVRANVERAEALGRWPANLIHDGSDEVVAGFPQSTSGTMKSGTQRAAQDGPGSVCYGTHGGNTTSQDISASSGSAARFFYCAKASKSERGEGNNHPTVKPIDLMKYLCRLVTPPNGTVLDPFLGSGTTGVAAVLEGFNFVGCELSPEYIEIAEKRIKEAEDSKNSGLESLFD